MTVLAPPVDPLPAARLDALVGVPLTHSHLDRWWGRQHVVEAGPPDAPPLVLLHGWPQHWFAWRHVIRALAHDARVVAPDTRAFGWSRCHLDRRARRAVTTPSLAADVVDLLDDLGLASAHLAGHDWGGWFAFHVALHHPARVRSLTAAAIMPPWLSAAGVVRRAAGLGYLLPMGLLGDRAARDPRVVSWLLRISTGDHDVWATDDGRTARAHYTDRLRTPEAQDVTRLLYRRMVAVELRQACGPRPGRLAMPARLVLGGREPIAHRDVFWSRTHPGEVELVDAPGAGHWVLDEDPGAVVGALQAALRG